MPGASEIKNIDILDDDGNSIRFTHVDVQLVTPIEVLPQDPKKQIDKIAITVSNAFVDGLRHVYDQHHIPYIYNTDKLGMINFIIEQDSGQQSSG